MKIRKFSVLSLIMILSILAGCGQTVTDNNGEKAKETKDELVVALTPTVEPKTGYDPTTGWGRVGSPLFQSTLLKLDENAKLVNDLATDYKISDDGLEYEFTLRDDAKFTDDTKVTAEDVAYTFETTANSGSVVDLNYVDKVEALDEKHVKFTLKNPQLPFLYAVAKTGIVPKHLHSDKYGLNPVGSGPYKFVQWDKGQQLIVEANENYYGKKPYFKKITFLYYDEDTAFAAAQAGEVDIAFTNPNSALQKIEGMKLVNVKTVDARCISMPCVKYGLEKDSNGNAVGNDVSSDINIRKAINIGINRKELVDGILNGYGEPAYSMCDSLPWGNDSEAFEDNKVDEAKKILEEAGWRDSDNDGIREKDGVKAELTLYYTTGEQVRQSVTIAVGEQIEKLGIKVNVEGKSWDEIYANYLHTNPVVFGKGTLDPIEMYNSYSSDLKGVLNNNPGYYSNPTVDDYMKKAFACTTEEESNKYWKEAQFDGTTGCGNQGDIAWIWLVKPDHLYFVREGLDIGKQLPHPHKYGYYDLTSNITDWRFE